MATAQPVRQSGGDVRRRRVLAAACALLVSLGPPPATFAQPAAPPQTPLGRCEDLLDLRIPADATGLPTGDAVVTVARRLAETLPRRDPDGEFVQAVPPHCNVQGQIRPVDPAAPPVTFNTNLPLAWNGRALQSGGEGLDGALITVPEQKASARFDPVPLTRPYPIALGYATFGSDGGHQGTDVALMRSDEAMRNWGRASMKKTRDVALRVVALAYGRPPDHVLFSGESAGGREAMMVAQHFPEDYYGVIAVSPVLAWNSSTSPTTTSEPSWSVAGWTPRRSA